MNFFALPGQAGLSLMLLCGGFGAGLVYEGVCLLRRSRWLFPAAEMLFSLGCAFVYALMIGSMGEERMRPVTVLIFGLGFALFRVSIRQGIIFCFRRISGRKKAADGEEYIH